MCGTWCGEVEPMYRFFHLFQVELVDKFSHPKTKRESHCYRITYRSMDKTFTDSEINSIQESVREEIKKKLLVELR